MAAAEIEASQSGLDDQDGGMGGPGAPTPLSALEVYLNPKSLKDDLSNDYFEL